jgi:peptidyl-prolyl cis-trans isomerase A (cyclophilin A)
MRRLSSLGWIPCAASVLLIAVACNEPPKAQRADALSAVSPASASASAAAAASSSAAAVKPSDPESDPLEGKFSLAEGTQALSGSGKLLADIETTAGKITCDLFEDKAPNTVANFVGLARGIRPWKDPSGKWVKRPAFDGLTFHRVIGRFMIQGGNPGGSGNAGYFFADEIWEGMTHDRAGQLCMANSGPDTNSMQFFITDGAARHLDKRGHTIFGDCKPTAIVRKIAMSKTDSKDAPLTPQLIKKVTIRRAGK